MRTKRQRLSIVLVGLALLICTSFVFLEAGFVHTDDGCAVEVHCLACRWALSTSVVFVHVPPLVPRLERAVVPVPEPVVILSAFFPDVPETRGPPA
jgi:hypothetical protein